MPLSNVSIYLLKHFENTTDLIRRPSRERRRPEILHETENEFFIGKVDGNKPEWVRFFENSIADLPDNSSLRRFTVQSSYGLYVFTTDVTDCKNQTTQRSFAIPLGHGIHLLDMSYIEAGFGLKTVVNIVPFSDLRQVDLTTPEKNSQKRKVQSSTNVDTRAFDINQQKDILKGIAGALPANVNAEQENDEEQRSPYELLQNIDDVEYPLGRSISGRDGLKVNCRIDDIETIKEICRRAYTVSTSYNYLEHFEWIDNFKAIGNTEPELITLDNLLCEAIVNEQIDHMTVAAPEYIDETATYDGYVFAGNGKRISDKIPSMFPEISDFLAEYRPKIADFSIMNENENNPDQPILNGVKLLKSSCRLLLVNSDDQNKTRSWPLYKAISWETTLNDERYILSEGCWYRIKQDFKNEVEEFFQQFIRDQPEFTPEAHQEHPLDDGSTKKYEAGYNLFASRITNGDTLLFDLGADRNMAVNGNEFCDLYHKPTKSMIHVKVGKSSSDLSHLFRQGAYSAQMLRADEGFRQVVHEKSNDQSFGDDGFDTAEFRVCFAVILKENQQQDIPFFSKVSFKDAVEANIERDGYSADFWFINRAE